MLSHRLLAAWTIALSTATILAASPVPNDLLHLPAVDTVRARMLSPQILEIERIWRKEKEEGATVSAEEAAEGRTPDLMRLTLTVDGQSRSILRAGFRQRPLYAPLQKRDLRVGSYVYLELDAPIPADSVVQLRDLDGIHWKSDLPITLSSQQGGFSPALHINQTGYSPGAPKHAFVGYYLGSLGELRLPDGNQSFQIVVAGKQASVVFEGKLKLRADKGWTPPAYQNVWEADFSSVNKEGTYQLHVPGLGFSLPFSIHPGVAAAVTRTYALGLYHQRCGTSNRLPYTRFTHDACHQHPLEIPPGPEIKFLPEVTADFTKTPRHTAPQLRDDSTSLYPFVKRGTVEAVGGHHDAGDYSRYTVNSAGLIHYLTFAVDNFEGVAQLDNLGLPESGDGKSDLLQEARWEAEFLSKLQDEDGGFYFLVYPVNRKYENNVLPDAGDPQRVWPKNTASTAAAVAALAQLGSSPAFRRMDGKAADRYLAQAEKGWQFLDRAIQKHGRDGAYQKLTHYGHQFLHDDELAWAASELFVATGKAPYQEFLRSVADPGNADTKRWGWWRMVEGYGRAFRSYAFGARSKRRALQDLDPRLLRACEAEVEAAAKDQASRAEDSAYGISFPPESKRVRSAGWFFAMERAFDLAVGASLDYPAAKDPRSKLVEAIWSNLNYEGGANPLNLSFLTGLGWRFPQEVVSQFAQNDWRRLPPTGLPQGNLQSGFGWLDLYQKELGELCYPPDGDPAAPYPLYDRWGESFNLSTEFVVLDQARGLATAAFLMGRSPLRTQPYEPIPAFISGVQEHVKVGQTHRLTLTFRPAATPRPASAPRILWEIEGEEPWRETEHEWKPDKTGVYRIEAEALWPDGKRAFAEARVVVDP